MRIPLTLNNSYKIVVKRLSGEALATLPGGNQQPLRNLMETAVALSSTVRHGHKDLEGIAQISWNAVRSVFSKYKQVLLKQMSEGNGILTVFPFANFFLRVHLGPTNPQQISPGYGYA